MNRCARLRSLAHPGQVLVSEAVSLMASPLSAGRGPYGFQNSALARAYGITALPYMVFLDADGKVTSRMKGERSIADIDSQIAKIDRSI